MRHAGSGGSKSSEHVDFRCHASLRPRPADQQRQTLLVSCVSVVPIPTSYFVQIAGTLCGARRIGGFLSHLSEVIHTRRRRTLTEESIAFVSCNTALVPIASASSNQVTSD
ncbi:hypothetical protein CGRA01v4_13456 [Colletotrichum graminicola]|uniref:Uncharacterized protein n=1 Tax=Colletotrichum graminicola (strain M1.001 / M2 / FGSC 10212) TaxID=645133 RepID=E3R0D1_COLGM|nr:uncharacterized protein GLRG_11728 [Colletotrichum graminicola M1.001]EFQ36569.1 hypothetical protein GLRG_11728 [Colletotrichum graminicola M1.001]WDK22165.1 hypothetical protein CGRA01v4_13456 [Colletotrichum graminicola]